MTWSLAEYCAGQAPLDLEALTRRHGSATAAQFLVDLNLPSVHPFCMDGAPPFTRDDVPPMGALDRRFDGQGVLEFVTTLWYMAAPPIIAMLELWLRLFAGLVGPLATLYLGMLVLGLGEPAKPSVHFNRGGRSKLKLSFVVVVAVASSAVVMTDTMYVLQNGPTYGAVLFVLSVGASLGVTYRFDLPVASVAVACLVVMSVALVWDGDTDAVVFGNKVDQVHGIREGLFYDPSNRFVSSIVSHWPESSRTYDKAHGATQWMPTGDSRTGLPFLLNHVPRPTWHRVFLGTADDSTDGSDDLEYVALDIAFPPTGHDASRPIYFILHGLNGGSDEGYVRDLTWRRNTENSTVVVMVARGLMDLPVRGWNIFHGARTSDAHRAASAVRKVASDDQILIGVGYSMGAIVLNNYVASYGEGCALHGAVAISGGLDTRYQKDYFRAQRLWQPMLAETMRDDFLLGKWGHRVKERLSRDDFLRMLRASHVTEIDAFAVVTYNGFNDLDHYYREMSALGDIPHDSNGLLPVENRGKIHDVSIPLVVVQAFDDPLVTYRATCQNTGFMYPENLVRSGTGYLMLLLTKAGGHVGWPLGTIPSIENWRWMSDVAAGFAQAVEAGKREKPV